MTAIKQNLKALIARIDNAIEAAENYTYKLKLERIKAKFQIIKNLDV